MVASPVSAPRQMTLWSARCFVDSGEKPEFIRTCEEEVCVMPASKYSPEFKEHVVAEVLETSRPIAHSSEVLQSGSTNCEQLGEQAQKEASRSGYGRGVIGSDSRD